MTRQKRLASNQQGFTIVELLIATAVLSTILVLVTIMMISIGNLYYKGVNQARVQGNVRSLTEELSQRLQLSGASPVTAPAPLPNFGSSTTIQAYCVDGVRYSYVLNAQIGHQFNGSGRVLQHVLWRDNTTGGACTPLDLTQANPSGGVLDSSNGTELIAPNSRLTFFSITGLAGPGGSIMSPYAVSLSVAYGDTDLLNLAGLDTTCRGTVGDQFCATASLTTTVVQRLSS